jgi:hypothetical protein
MIKKVLKNRWIIAVDLFNDEKLNSNGVSVDKIERMLIQEHLNVNRPVVIPLAKQV